MMESINEVVEDLKAEVYEEKMMVEAAIALGLDDF
jgi:hypothetical protein